MINVIINGTKKFSLNEANTTELACESKTSRLCEWRFRMTAVATEAIVKGANKSVICQAGSKLRRIETNR